MKRIFQCSFCLVLLALLPLSALAAEGEAPAVLADAAETFAASGYLRSGETDTTLYYWTTESLGALYFAEYDAQGRMRSVTALNPEPLDAAASNVHSKKLSWTADNAPAEGKLLAIDPSGAPAGPAWPLAVPDPDNEPPSFSVFPELVANTFDSNSSQENRCYAWITVTADKTCSLRWALTRDGANVTMNHFRTNVIPGALDSGMVALSAGRAYTLRLSDLRQLTSYQVHMWLTDPDFASNSQIHVVPLMTVDSVSPVFTKAPQIQTILPTSLTFTYAVSEEASVYWAAVVTGTDYPPRPTGGGSITAEHAQEQIRSGKLSFQYGSGSADARKEAYFTVPGLNPQTSYDIWYFAQDPSGNTSEFPIEAALSAGDRDSLRGKCLITAQTQDTVPPTAELEYTIHDEENAAVPLADTDIRVVFSEEVQRQNTGQILTEFYDRVKAAEAAVSEAEAAGIPGLSALEDAKAELDDAREALAACLRATVRLYRGDSPAPEYGPASLAEGDWTVDYRFATIEDEDGRTVITFPTRSADSALNLRSGTSYRFRLTDLSDTALPTVNPMDDTWLGPFTTRPAQADLKSLTLRTSQYPPDIDTVDAAFSVTPTSTARSDGDACWDMVIWADTSLDFEMFVRSRPADSSEYDYNWRRLGSLSASGGVGRIAVVSGEEGSFHGRSLHLDLNGSQAGELLALSNLRDDRVYEYAIHVRSLNGDPLRSNWNKTVRFRISVIAGNYTDIGDLAHNIDQDSYNAFLEKGQDLTYPDPFEMSRAYSGTVVPDFYPRYPQFRPSDTRMDMILRLDRTGTVYYVIAPADGTVLTRDLSGAYLDALDAASVPRGGAVEDPFYLSQPTYLDVVHMPFEDETVKTGSVSAGQGILPVPVEGLRSDTDYFAYFVLQGSGQNYSQYAQLFYFHTEAEALPVLSYDLTGSTANLSPSQNVTLDYMLASLDGLGELFTRSFWGAFPSGNREAPAEFPAYAKIETVLQAMNTPVDPADSAQGTVFDAYAGDSARSQMAAYLRSAEANTAILGVGHGVEVTAGSWYAVDCEDFDAKPGDYALIATVSSSTGRTFLSVYPLVQPDLIPPSVIRVQSNLTVDSTGTLINGTVVLTFDETLWYRDTSVTPPRLKQVDNGLTSGGRRGDYPGFVGAETVVFSRTSDYPIVMLQSDSLTGVSTRTLTLVCNGVRDRSFISFKTELCDQFGNMRDTGLDVNLLIRPAEDGTGTYTCQVQINEDWDGR